MFSVLQETTESVCIILGILTSFFGLAISSKKVSSETLDFQKVMKETDKRPLN